MLKINNSHPIQYMCSLLITIILNALVSSYHNFNLLCNFFPSLSCTFLLLVCRHDVTDVGGIVLFAYVDSFGSAGVVGVVLSLGAAVGVALYKVLGEYQYMYTCTRYNCRYVYS